jgi:hypothetical protein
MKALLAEPRFRAARLWSNRVLAAIAPHLGGAVVNVSGWRDEDKEGRHYRDYFTRATEYWITNWKSEARGYQGDRENELFLDLEQPLPDELRRRFDVVFNHTTLEHVFDIFTAFHNLCELSRDCVIVVVPFLQEEHGDYGDYWRFTPQALRRLFQREALDLAYLAANDQAVDAIYIVAVGARSPSTREMLRQLPGNAITSATVSLGRHFWSGPRLWHGVRRLRDALRGWRK